MSVCSTSSPSERGADGGDDRTGERDRDERAEKPAAEEARADPRKRRELEGDHHDRDEERRAELRDEKRERVQDPAQEGAGSGDRAPEVRISTTGQLAVVRESLGK